MAEQFRRDARAPLAGGWTALVLAVLLAACASSSFQRAEDTPPRTNGSRPWSSIARQSPSAPDDAEYRSRLRRAELTAADYYYKKGQIFLEKGNIEEAIAQFQQGLAAMPDHGKLQQAMASAIARNEAANLYQEGLNLRQAGKTDDARRAFQRALEVYPDHKDATAALAELKKEDQEKLTEGLALSSKAPITLNFRQTDLKQTFEFLAKSSASTSFSTSR